MSGTFQDVYTWPVDSAGQANSRRLVSGPLEEFELDAPRGRDYEIAH